MLFTKTIRYRTIMPVMIAGSMLLALCTPGMHGQATSNVTQAPALEIATTTAPRPEIPAAATPLPGGTSPAAQTSAPGQPESPGAAPEAFAPTPQAPAAASISVDVLASGKALDRRVLGSNLPSWLNPSRFSDSVFRERIVDSGSTLVRIPGGSWSNSYDWLACENGGTGIDANAVCWWTWASRPSDFIQILRALNVPGMWTVNQNGTSKEAAALVAFFNGDANDTQVIGVDVRGRDWGTVGDWAQLRADHGSPQPYKIQYWEIGNETYGGKPDTGGSQCSEWGWEDVWTCDGTEYVNGKGTGSSRKEGFIEFRNAMRAVDSSIQVGAVGVWPNDGWSNWGNEVIQAAGAVMDFYVVHQYAYFQPPAAIIEPLAEPRSTWKNMIQDVQASFDTYAGGRIVPLAITEFNLFSVQENDWYDWMSKAVNMLFIGESVGQMMENGFSIANQWNISAYSVTNPNWDTAGYGLFYSEGDSMPRAPQYYAYSLWERFGSTLLPVSNSANPNSDLSVYAGKLDADTITLMAINKTGSSISASINFTNASGVLGGWVDSARASSLEATTVTYNGTTNGTGDMDAIASTALPNPANPLSYSFPPYSITLLRVDITTEIVPPTPTPPTPTSTPPTPTPTPPPDWWTKVFIPLVRTSQ
jgi:hypothetical protein